MTSHQHHMVTRDKSDRYRETLKVTVIGSVVDLALAVLKILVGITAHSQALIADGIHSLSDLGTDLVVIYAAKHAHREADEEHPYGHGRIETLATVGLALALIGVAVGISFDAVRRLMNPELLSRPGYWALVIAAISVLSKEAIYHYTMRVANRLRSDMLRANAWHSRSDAISSIVVIIGVAGAMAGFPSLDSVAAIGVAIMIGKIGFDLIWESSQELIDTALDKETNDNIREAILNIGGVVNLHQLRTRHSGSDALADVHIQVSPEISVSEGHQISESVRQAVMQSVPSMIDVTVHIDPEDDGPGPRCDGLPLRDQLLQELDEVWRDQPLAQEIQDIKLHYLSGKIDIELYLQAAPHHPGTHTQINALIAATQRHSCINRVAVFFKHAP